jgi:hypothetical protein
VRVGHLACAHDYRVTVSAVDIAGNASAPATVTATTLRCR